MAAALPDACLGPPGGPQRQLRCTDVTGGASDRCQAAQREALSLFVRCAEDSCLPVHSRAEIGQDDPHERLKVIFSEYLDLHSEKAFLSSFFEPAETYWRTVGDTTAEIHVKRHDWNWYAAILNAPLRVQLPKMPHYLDTDHYHGVTPFGSGGPGREHEKPESFGQCLTSVKRTEVQNLPMCQLSHPQACGGFAAGVGEPGHGQLRGRAQLSGGHCDLLGVIHALFHGGVLCAEGFCVPHGFGFARSGSFQWLRAVL
mmetsp:Transcript_168269/g.540607  ORF Transcript_168269/g.540607 Transcript_168269/m.540607 type:complete len:257 (+) Transcript_168269:380-1150(+)